MIDITYRPSVVPTFGRVRPRRPVLARAIETLLTFQERARQRHALRSLDERALKDIGLTRADVELECSKPFWKA